MGMANYFVKTVHVKVWNILDGKPTFSIHSQRVKHRRMVNDKDLSDYDKG